MSWRGERLGQWRIGIIGLGHVGKITAEVLQVRSLVTTYDISNDDTYPYADFHVCDFLVVCVNTPEDPETGAADLSEVEAAFSAMPPGVPVVLRSTVPPGTSMRLAADHDREVIFWPEYVGESRFVVDTMKQLDSNVFQIVGAVRSDATSKWVDLLAETYGPLVRIYQIEQTEAEIVKYMENSYFAVKTIFVNEFRNLCEALDADWQSVREGWLLDPRIGRDHSDAFMSSPGYGGRCLPKDIAAVRHRAKEIGTEMPLLDAVSSINFRLRELPRQD